MSDEDLAVAQEKRRHRGGHAALTALLKHALVVDGKVGVREGAPQKLVRGLLDLRGTKATFDRFHGIYYLGWQEATRVNKVSRSVFNIDVSADCVRWERKYRFETEKSFQYPTFREHQGSVYLTVTPGDFSKDRKERIMFGKLE